ncbi:hypothetical protein [Paracoccus sp. SCSIO 75233]|uniref:hypothetical protein n=1 Tax=Paracoccus sp. SCSIO 75233 TaxID=3017782 RepID=UPI0022F095BE|nr:hypothetical protein [Paracoccus sp. SCSIO 75233]WBU52435.1 hypothetical protein PAF12_11465 [Paracoccus sp. SCSIO 75233]
MPLLVFHSREPTNSEADTHIIACASEPICKTIQSLKPNRPHISSSITTMSNSRLQSQKAIRGANRLALPQAAGSEVSRTALPPFGEGVFRSARRSLQADFFQKPEKTRNTLILRCFYPLAEPAELSLNSG